MIDQFIYIELLKKIWPLPPPISLSISTYLSQVLLPVQTGSQVDDDRLTRALSQLDDTLDKLETMFLRRQSFLCGDDITLADLLAICELMQVRDSDWFTY